MFFIIFIIIIIACGVGAGILARRRLPEKRRRFDNREKIDSMTIYDKYYDDIGIDTNRFLDLWNKIGDVLKLDPGLLRPSDSFDNELKPVEGYFVEDELMDLQDYLKKEAKTRNISLNGVKLNTLDDVIKLFCR